MTAILVKVSSAVLAGYTGTSTTSLAIGTGSKTLTTQSGLAYAAGLRVRAAYDASNYMEGPVTSYSALSLVLSVDKTAGSGTYASWNIGPAGEPGAAGATGATGAAPTRSFTAVKTSAYNIAASDDIIPCSTVGGTPFTVNLPGSPTTGESHTVVDIYGNAAGAAITVSGNGKSVNTGGDNSWVIQTAYGFVQVVYDGTRWVTVAHS